MKKIIFTLTLLFVTISVVAKEHLSFKGIPIEGSMTEFCQKLKAKGFTSIYRENNRASFSGAFTGHDAEVGVIATDDGKNVFGVFVSFDPSGEWDTLVNTYFDYKNLYTRKYGKPILSRESMPKRSDSHTAFIAEVYHGTVVYSSRWEGTGGLIQLSIVESGSNKCKVVIYYRDSLNYESKIQNCLFGASSLFAQSKQDTLFYDKNWKGVESKSLASYYRILSGNADSNFGKRYRDYYVTGELQGEGGYISIDKYDDSKSVMDGENTTYYKNGLISLHCTMKSGKPNGILTQFNEKGDMCSQTEMLDGNPRYDYYILSNKDGFGGKFRISDNTPIWESPSQYEKKTEYKNGAAWPYYIKNGLMVAMTNTQVKDYGNWYQISIVVSNNSIVPIDFDPSKITSTLKKTNGQEVALEVYSADKYMRKVRRTQNWNMVFAGFAEGLAAAGAGYSSSTTHTNSSYNGNSSYYGNSFTISHTVKYDGAAAYQAQVIASNRMANYENALLQDREIKQEGYLKRTTIYPGQAISGYINIKRIKGDTMDVIIDINGAQYVFPWNIAKLTGN